MNAQVRIHSVDEQLVEKFMSYLNSNCNDNWIIYAHKRSDFPTIKNDHIHAYIKGYKRTAETLRENIKTIFGVTRGGFSVSETYEKDGKREAVNDDAITYMSKGKLDPLYSKFDSEYVYSKKIEWVEKPIVAKVVLQGGKLVRQVDESKKKTKHQLVQEMISEVGEDIRNQGRVVEVIRKVLIKNGEMVGMYKVIDFYDCVKMIGDKDSWREMICEKINSRIRI